MLCTSGPALLRQRSQGRSDTVSGHHHHHHHHFGDDSGGAGDRRVAWAVAVNVLLTVAQAVGGIFAGSLSLVADALHNLSDAASLGIAFMARRIARRPSDDSMTFGYVRAEIIAALINYTTLIVVGLYLVYEAILRFFDPEPVDGWLVVIIAGVALVIDLATAALTYALSKESMNIRAAFLHNVADALGSIGVIVAGTLILLFGWTIVDPIITLVIAGYILWQAFAEIGATIRILMQGTPPDIDVADLVAAISEVRGVQNVHHLHIWSIDERHAALEAHIVLGEGEVDVAAGDAVKQRIKAMVSDRFGISHTTLEVERVATACTGDSAQIVGHRMAEPEPAEAGHAHHGGH
ncbi:MAG: cation transporter [Bauldia sp.]|nr:cation transporter [Bauldia sp.]